MFLGQPNGDLYSHLVVNIATNLYIFKYSKPYLKHGFKQGLTTECCRTLRFASAEVRY